MTYTPDAGFSGTDSFSYTIENGSGRRDEATVTVAVLPKPKPVSLDCWKDEGTVGTLAGRALDGLRTDDRTGMTVAKCASTCASASGSFRFFGVQAGYGCFCDNDDDKDYDFFGKADNCNIACPGDPTKICGGH